MKLEKNKNLSIFLTTYWNLSYNSGNLGFFFFKIWWIWVIFFMKNPLYRSKSYFSDQNVAKIRQWKKHYANNHHVHASNLGTLYTRVEQNRAILLVKSCKLDPRPLEEDPRPIQAMEMSHCDSLRCKLVFNIFFFIECRQQVTQCYAIMTHCNEITCAMTWCMTIIKSRTMDDLFLCSFIVCS
jgi:hypothetical protein